ncbi:MAG TPA: ADOP family duplicated permease [Vicinamibacterales bacterium]|nr:ADOP family duplicated permease [Vicinamibacterales bacterium]
MRHPLNVLLRIGRSDAERSALLGDLEETYRRDVRPSRSWLRAQAWYTREVLAAAASALRDGSARPRLRTGATSDVRYALRRWRRRPGFAAAAILTLGLGIAAATATFSVIDAVLLRPLPWTDAERLVVIHGVYPNRRSNPATAPTWNRGLLSYPAWDALRTTPLFETVGVWRSIQRLDTTFGEDRTDIVRTMDVSSNFLPMLGVRMALGRYFTEQEDNVNNDSIILTYETWQRRFGAHENIIGEHVQLGSASSGDRLLRTIVGVLEPGFRFEGEPPEILNPVGIAAAVSRQYPSATFRVVGRLAPGVSVQAAEAAAASIVHGSPFREPVSARLVTLEDEHLGSARRPLWLLFAGAGLLLLIACSNVAGLLLGEARARRHEIAVRAALGGSRARVARQLVIEHILIALAASTLGLVLAAWLIGGVIALAPEGLPRIETVTVDVRAAMFALGAGLLTLLVFGVAPALSLARTPVARTLAEGGRDGAIARLLGQRAIVIVQISLALVLLTGAALFAETMRRLTSQPLGFDPRNVTALSTTFTGSRFGEPSRLPMGRGMSVAERTEAIRQVQREVENARIDLIFQHLSAVLGVTAAAGASAVPFLTAQQRLPIVLEGRPESERHDSLRQTVTKAYFDTMGMQLLSGRLFGDGDRAGADAVVVSREFERRFFPDGALNRRFRHVYGARYELSINHHVVGIVSDVKRQDFSDDDRPAFYTFDRQTAGISHFLVRMSGEPDGILPSVRRAVAAASPQTVVTSMVPMENLVARSVADERFRAMLSSLFGASALALAAVGLYGVITRRAADRRREFGIRVALGARPSDVRELVLKDAVHLIVLGLAIGLPAAYAAAQLTRTLLFGVSPSSPHVFALTSLMLALVAAFASLLPARRAGGIDPISVLRT